MSSRLKRKLGDLGVDTSSARATESFCLIGTPLPPLEKSKDTGEFVPLWKQDVRDEKGRRRLHGAFTGGFSAGYFNTVGSKEGWAPSSFVSSRSERAKQKSSRPEDFMDDEDLAEFRESQKLVDENEQMDILGGTQAELRQRGDEDSEADSLAKTLEASMLPQPNESAGARILKKMGWRIGQGIGPRISWKQRRLQDLQASSGRLDVRLEELPLDDDEEANKHTYARRDTPVVIAPRKDNTFGLGYTPGLGLNETLGVASSSTGPNLSGGFGLGALNDADEDDLDVYDGSSNQNQNRNRMAWDAADDNDDHMTLSRAGKKSKLEARSAPSSGQTFRDGRPVLAGFELSNEPIAEDRWFPLPDVPKGWQPDPKRVWDKNKENETPEVAVPHPSGPVPHAKWKTGISADERGTILGETPLPSAPRSVFEYMSQKDRERLKNITTSADLPPPPQAAGPSASPVVPRTEPHIAQAALGGFQPYTADPVKQARYTAYLLSQSAPSEPAEPPAPFPGQTTDEYNKELADYAKAAQIFKPITGAMAGRFTSAAVVDHGPKIHEGLHTPAADEPSKEPVQEKMVVEESPKEHAARVGMYGPLTRETKVWVPARLLCKRFGVKEPESVAPEPAATAAAPSEAADSVAELAPDASFRVAPDQLSGGRKGGKRDLANIGLGEDEEQGKDTLTYERPAMDIFKAIFASDDEDSDEEDGDKAGAEDGAVAVATAAAETPPAEGPATRLVLTAPVQSSVPVQLTAKEEEKVDTSTFKPTFVPRSERATKSKDKDAEKERKRDKKKKAAKVIVSFELEEGEDSTLSIQPKDKERKAGDRDRPKKKKRKEKDKGSLGDEDDGMWVEKPPPEIVKSLPLEPVLDSQPELNARETPLGPARGRKRAVDFM